MSEDPNDRDLPEEEALGVAWQLLVGFLRDHAERRQAERLSLPVLVKSPRALHERMQMGSRYYQDRIVEMLRWAVSSAEADNFSTPLPARNRLHLAHFLSTVLNKPVDLLDGYMQELLDDQELAANLAANTIYPRGPADLPLVPGRRLGWYATVRAMKPRLVVETGVSKGLGAIILCAALRRNTAEGHPGYYLGTEINPTAGHLLTPPYSEMGRIAYNDSIATLQRLQGPIDLFINDSDHDPGYEAREYEVVKPLLAEDAIIISDNAHISDALCHYAVREGLSYLFFREETEQHWYPGAGIGVAWRR